MPKVKSSRRTLVQKWLNNIKNEHLTCINGDVVCSACNDKKITCNRKSQIEQHLCTKGHKQNVEILNSSFTSIDSNCSHENQQQTKSTRQNQFFIDMCEAMVAIKLPWRSLNNEVWRKFLTKYTSQKIPDESTLRKSYLDDYYHRTLINIEEDLGGNYIWISVDETTDLTGRQVANLIVGKLCEEEETMPHLVACKFIDKTNYETISRFINSSLQAFYNNVEFYEKVLLIVTDAAAYMLKAVSHLKVFYPNMKHLTCLAHGFHRIAEEIRNNFPEVNKLISSGKKVFLKAPLRIQAFKEKLPDTSLPPEPVLTRWGTWIEAALYYAENLEDIKGVIELFDANEVSSIKSVIQVFENDELTQDLAYIKSHFSNLPKTITRLESLGLPLSHSLEIANNFIRELHLIPGVCGEKIKLKIRNVFKRNPDFEEISQIGRILRHEKVESIVNVPSKLWSKYKYAPVTSCDVERSFSAYKLLLTDKRHNLTIENIEKSLILYCYLNYNLNV